MKKMDHINLVKLYEVIDDPQKQKLYLIMDYMDLGYLGSSNHRSHLGLKTDVLPLEKIWEYFRAVIQGIDYRKNLTTLLTPIVHTVARVVHFDIKPENILVNKEDVVKIADFGISKFMNASQSFIKVGGTKMF